MAKKKNRNAAAQPQPLSTSTPSKTTTTNSSYVNVTNPNTKSSDRLFEDSGEMVTPADSADIWQGSGFEDPKEIAARKNYLEHHWEAYALAKSIYAQDCRLDIGRKTVWGKDILGFKIVISSYRDAAVFTELDVELPPEYPKIGATFHLIKLQPYSERLLADITAIMEAGKKWRGDNDMAVNVLGEILDRLDDEAAAIEERAQGTSLEQERATSESAAKTDVKQKEQLALRQREEEKLKSEAALAQEIESHRRRNRLLSSSHSGLDHQTGIEEDYPEDCVVFSNAITIHDPKRDTNVSFRAVLPMETLFEREGKKVSTAIPYRNRKHIPFPLVLKQVRLPPGMDSEAEYRQLLNKIEKNLKETKSFDHAAIVKIHDFKLEQIPDTMSTSHWEFTILTERADCPLPALMSMAGCLKAPELRRYARSILDAFEFFDRKGYVHPAVHAYNILFFGDENRPYCAKLSDGYGTALRNLVDQAHYGKKASELNHPSWAPPELSNEPPSRNNKTCIFELGVIMLQMVFGNDLTIQYTGPTDALEKGKLDPDLDDLITIMCRVNPRKRPTAFQLQSHHYFQSNMPFVFEALNRAHRMKSQGSSDSKWAEDWESVGKLGKGGFGTVFKARNRMDGHFYAVKQMKCETIKDMNEIKGEVRMLASLNHPVIVRYFNAWTEDEQPDVTDSSDSNAQTDPRSFALQGGSAGTHGFTFGNPSGLDFQDPMLTQALEAEDEEDEKKRQATENASESSDDDGNPFGYQSAPSDSSDDDDNSQAVQDDDEEEDMADALIHQGMAEGIDEESNPFQDNSPASFKDSVKVPSRPQTFKPAGNEPSMFRRPRQYNEKSSTLYIQMELCETGTLADVIKKGLPNTVREIWRILRFILDGLDHIHSMKVVHRDLKPLNIFIDSQKMPKIGDFGLASPSQALSDGEKMATHVYGPQSKGVGTLFYIAPELDEKTATGEYSAKADMFALGVILFEMCYPFETAVERYDWLGKINKDPSTLPPRFDQEDYKVQGRIIRSLLDHNPDKRPSAKDLLLDPEIPEPLETEKEGRFVQRLIHGDKQQFQRVIDSFMEKKADLSQTMAYTYVGKDEFASVNRYTASHIVQKLEECFRVHGGVESSRETVLPIEGLYSSEQKPVRFIDPAGFTVQLPSDLTAPFARAIAVRKPDFVKSFCFGTVFRQREVGVEPLCVPEVDFDLVSYSARDLSLKDAQVISVLDDCLTKLAPLFVRSFTIVISHGDLLDFILGACEVPEGRFEVVKHLLSGANVGKTTWKQVESDLAGSAGLAATTVAAISRFNISSSFGEMRQQVLASLQMLRKTDLAMKAARPLSRLQEVDDFLGRLRVRTTVLFAPLSVTSETLYKGSLMFKCVDSKLRKIVAIGGRYDALVRSYQTPTHKTFARAAGMRINIMDLARFAGNDAQAKSASKTTKSQSVLPASMSARVDVVVTSFDPDTLQSSCLEVLRNILDAGISAELSDLYTTMDELDTFYSSSSKYWVVIVRSLGGNTAQRTIKVRSPTRDETDIPPSDLLDHLRSELNDGRPTLNQPEPSLRRTRSSHGASAHENITILTPQHKSKKINRAAVVDSARTAAQELTDSIGKNYKVLAIDTDDETLQKIRNTRLSDAESWRTLRHSVALNERDYVSEVQKQLGDWSGGGHEGAFLCNYKTGKCILYDFGRV